MRLPSSNSNCYVVRAQQRGARIGGRIEVTRRPQQKFKFGIKIQTLSRNLEPAFTAARARGNSNTKGGRNGGREGLATNILAGMAAASGSLRQSVLLAVVVEALRQ